MVLRENNHGVKDIFCEYAVLGVGAQRLCYFFVFLSPTVSCLWGIDLQHLAPTCLSSPYPQLVSAPLPLFHHSDRVSLLKASESTEARKLYAHCMFNNGVHLMTVSTI